MEERPVMWRVAVDIVNYLSWTAGKVWFSSLGVGEDANNSSLEKHIMLQNSQKVELHNKEFND
jgi:hypothetical protein